MSGIEPVGIVTLLTDFGSQDTYVGQMKGAILATDVSLRIVDLTHEVPPHDIVEGAFQLWSAVDAFPSGTVHVAVVDPGVGTKRRAIGMTAQGCAFIAPDNGLLSHLIPNADSVFEIRNPRILRSTATATFHGRDVFAPAGAQIAARKIELEEFGPAIDPDSLVRLEASVKSDARDVCGQVVSIDRFGNCITMLREDEISAVGLAPEIVCKDFHVKALSRTFGDVGVGGQVAYIGSAGTLELAIRNGHAALQFDIQRGDWVIARSAEDS